MCELCVHTNNKKYTAVGDFEASQFSSINIGNHSVIPNLDALNNKIWDENETVYWQLDSDYDWLSNDILEDVMKDAFLEPSLTTKLKIQQKRRQTGDAHIKVRWVHSKDEHYFETRPGVLAFAYGPQRGIGGDITFNADYAWRLPQDGRITVKEAFDLGMIPKYDTEHPDNHLRTYDPYHTAKHEGGHALGMRHITDINRRNDTVMFPFYNGLRMFGQADLDYFFQLYTQIGSWERAVRIAKRKMGWY